MADVTMKVGDTLPVLEVQLVDSAGDAIVLAVDATVQFRMRAAAGGALKVNAAATVVDRTTGTVRFNWASGHTDTAGLFFAEFQVTDSSGVITHPSARHLEVLLVPVV